jgi:molybdenum cofactor cytidylyltransferase
MLIERHRETGKLIVQPTYQGRRGHPVLFAASLFDELRAAPPEVGARHVVYQHAADMLEMPTDEEGIVLNINDKAAYEKVLQMLPPN